MYKWLNFILMILTLPESTISDPPKGPLVLMVGMDSFRYDFIDRGRTTNFRKVIASGVKAEHVVNVFPTKSKPNWYTIMTGLYPESHGVVNNHVYDPKVTPGKQVTLNTSDPMLWAEAEPIWITNQRQGGSSGVFNFSFGGFVDNGGMAINYHNNWLDTSMKTKEKLVDSVLDLFLNGSINFGLIYVDDLDYVCHLYGPESDESMEAVEEMDRMVGYILQKLKQSNLLGVINVLFVSDHGHVRVFPNKTVFLDDKVNKTLYYGVRDNPVYSVFPHRDEDIATIYNQLIELEHVVVYKKEDMPEEYHYRHNERIPPILLMANVGWVVTQSESDKLSGNKGVHGYSNRIPKMWPFFVAMGPAFKEGYISKPINTTDIYLLVCHILKLEPRPHNGSLENVMQLLVDGTDCDETTRTRNTTNVISGINAFLLVAPLLMTLVLLMSFRKMAKYRRRHSCLVRRARVRGGLLDVYVMDAEMTNENKIGKFYKQV